MYAFRNGCCSQTDATYTTDKRKDKRRKSGIEGVLTAQRSSSVNLCQGQHVRNSYSS
jgi:hypothetical protein